MTARYRWAYGACMAGTSDVGSWFPVPDEADLDPGLKAQLGTWCAQLPVALPIGVGHVFLSCWIRLYGMVCMEIFGHLRFALHDAEPMFEAELRSMAEMLGVGDEYQSP